MPRVGPEQLQLEAARQEPPPQPRAASAPFDRSNAHRPAVADLLDRPGALLTRTDLRELGLERRAVDAVFRTLPVVALPGYSRPMIRAEQYLELVEQHTYRNDRVRA